jgi:putative transcriptional regulator
MGVVLNRESETRVAEVVPQLAELAAQDELIRIGGPVAPQSVVALGEFGDPSEAGTHVVGALGTLDPDSPNESLLRLRVYAGYAGWGPSQLDGELEQEAWLVTPAEADDPFSDEDLCSPRCRRTPRRTRRRALRRPASRPPTGGTAAGRAARWAGARTAAAP